MFIKFLTTFNLMKINGWNSFESRPGHQKDFILIESFLLSLKRGLFTKYNKYVIVYSQIKEIQIYIFLKSVNIKQLDIRHHKKSFDGAYLLSRSVVNASKYTFFNFDFVEKEG